MSNLRVSGHEVEFGTDGSYATVKAVDVPQSLVFGRTRIEAVKKLIDKLEQLAGK